MSMTDLAVFRNVKTQETVVVAVATTSIGMPRGGLVLDVNLKTLVEALTHKAVCADGAKAP